MTLSEYLKAQGLKQGEAARELGVSDAVMSRFCKRTVAPSLEMAMKIHAWSDRMVSFEELAVGNATADAEDAPCVASAM